MLSKRRLLIGGVTLAAAGTLVAQRGFAQSDGDQDSDVRLLRGVVYIESNIAAAGENSVLGYRYASDGTLTPLPGSPFATGGSGFFFQNPPLGPFDGDQQLIIDRRRGVLYAVDAGSDSVAAMRIGRDGSLSRNDSSPFAFPSANPISLAVHRDSLLVLSANADPSQSSGHHPSLGVAFIRWDGDDLLPVPASLVTLPDGSVPSQVLTQNTGPFIFTNEFVGGTIRSFAERPEGLLVQVDTQTPPQQAGTTAPPLPLGLWANDRAPILYVGFATTNQVGVYSWDSDGKLTFLRTATNSGIAPCWLRTGFGGQRLYTINTGNNSITVYDSSDPGNPKEIQNVVVGGLGGLTQFDITPDYRFLFVIEQVRGSAVVSRLRVIAINPSNGTVAEIAAAALTIPVPANTIPLGVVAL